MKIDDLTLEQIKEIKSLLSDENQPPPNEFIGKYVIARTYSAGVFAGILKSKNGKEVILADSRRIWYWKGAASLSQLAIDGTNKPNDCKFPAAVNLVLLTECIEINLCTEKAEESIKEVPIWKE